MSARTPGTVGVVYTAWFSTDVSPAGNALASTTVKLTLPRRVRRQQPDVPRHHGARRRPAVVDHAHRRKRRRHRVGQHERQRVGIARVAVVDRVGQRVPRRRRRRVHALGHHQHRRRALTFVSTSGGGQDDGDARYPQRRQGVGRQEPPAVTQNGVPICWVPPPISTTMVLTAAIGPSAIPPGYAYVVTLPLP